MEELGQYLIQTFELIEWDNRSVSNPDIWTDRMG